MTARIATNGKKIEPTIFKKNKKENYKQIDINVNHLKIVKNALYKVVNEKKGTAFKPFFSLDRSYNSNIFT